MFNRRKKKKEKRREIIDNYFNDVNRLSDICVSCRTKEHLESCGRLIELFAIKWEKNEKLGSINISESIFRIYKYLKDLENILINYKYI